MKATSTLDIQTVLLEAVAAGYPMTVSTTDEKGQTGKRPIGGGWQKRPITTGNAAMDAMQNPQVTGAGGVGLSVVDIDGPRARENFIQILREQHIDAETFRTPMVVQTGRGAGYQHMIYRSHPEVSNSGGILALVDGVDCRGVGGFNCMVALGRVYTFQDGLIPYAELPEPPDVIKGRAVREGADISMRPAGQSWAPRVTEWGESTFKANLAGITDAKEGGRHDAVYRAALIGGHLLVENDLDSVETVYASIEKAATEAGLIPGQREPEVHRTIRDGLSMSLGTRSEYLVGQWERVQSWSY